MSNNSEKRQKKELAKPTPFESFKKMRLFYEFLRKPVELTIPDGITGVIKCKRYIMM